jgi:hypothetical protein
VCSDSTGGARTTGVYLELLAVLSTFSKVNSVPCSDSTGGARTTGGVPGAPGRVVNLLQGE